MYINIQTTPLYTPIKGLQSDALYYLVPAKVPCNYVALVIIHKHLFVAHIILLLIKNEQMQVYDN